MKKTFAHHAPSINSLGKIQQLREAYSELSELVEVTAPSSRERQLGITNLEQSAMWAIKAVVINDVDSHAEGMEGASNG